MLGSVRGVSSHSVSRYAVRHVISMHTYLQQKQMCESGFDLVEEGFSLMRDGR
jgi:hypothetical protein